MAGKDDKAVDRLGDGSAREEANSRQSVHVKRLMVADESRHQALREQGGGGGAETTN